MKKGTIQSYFTVEKIQDLFGEHFKIHDVVLSRRFSQASGDCALKVLCEYGAMLKVALDPRPHSLMFHHFHGEAHLEVQGSIDVTRFEECLDYYGTRLISASEWLRRALDGALKGDEVCVSFDDMLCCQYDVALPVLQSGHSTLSGSSIHRP